MRFPAGSPLRYGEMAILWYTWLKRRHLVPNKATRSKQAARSCPAVCPAERESPPTSHRPGPRRWQEKQKRKHHQPTNPKGGGVGSYFARQTEPELRDRDPSSLLLPPVSQPARFPQRNPPTHTKGGGGRGGPGLGDSTARTDSTTGASLPSRRKVKTMTSNE